MTELQTAAKLDWRDTFQCGLGVSAPSAQPMRSAIEAFELPPPDDAVKTSFQAVMIDSQEKASKLIDTSASASFNAFGVEGEFSAAWRKEMSYGSRQVTVLLQSTIEWQPQVMSPGSARLSAEARAQLAKGADRFRRVYGDYYLAGYQRRARFFVAYRLEAHDEQSLSAFKASAKVSGYEAFGEASVALTSEAEKHQLSIECVGIQEGVRGGEGAQPLPLKPGQLLKAYETFEKRAVGVPSTAILYHYALVEPDVHCAIDVTPEVLVAAKSLFLRLWDCSASLQGVPAAYRQELSDSLTQLRDRIEAQVPRSLDCSVETVQRLTAQLDDWCGRYAEVQMYQRLWLQLKATAVVGSGNNSASNTPSWHCGLTAGSPVLASLRGTAENSRFPGRAAPAPEVHEIYNERYRIDWHVGHRYWNPVVSRPGFRICGYEIIANKSDDGSWGLAAGGLTCDNISLRFGSDYDRGIDWTVRVWGIPAAHLEFEGPSAGASRVLALGKAASRRAGKARPAAKKVGRTPARSAVVESRPAAKPARKTARHAA